MIAMFIFGTEKNEIQCVYQYAKSLAGRWTDEYWGISILQTEQDLRNVIEKKEHADIICMDITVPRGLELAKLIREQNPTAYLILIADSRISPVSYMRPSIAAESLLLKPLTKEMVGEIISEAFQTFLKRFQKPDESQVFVLDNKEGRTLIPFDIINFFEARDKRVYLNTNLREYGFYETLDQLEEQLTDQFIRCHRGFLVNKYKILQILLSRNMIVLEGEVEIPVSRTYKAALKDYRRGGAKIGD